jgi:hypothetical protein
VAIHAGIGIEDGFGRFDPVDLGGGLRPEAARIALPARVIVEIAAGANVR